MTSQVDFTAVHEKLGCVAVDSINSLHCSVDYLCSLFQLEFLLVLQLKLVKTFFFSLAVWNKKHCFPLKLFWCTLSVGGYSGLIPDSVLAS